MKKDGSLVKLSEKWFGRVPPPDALERTITPGYGVPVCRATIRPCMSCIVGNGNPVLFRASQGIFLDH